MQQFTRKIALEEGIFVGNSGACVKVTQLKEHFKPDDSCGPFS
jgi:hypothetical protein